MNPLIRWAKFNAVGVLGMAVQLASLAGLNHLLAGHYLVATCTALELTLLHNFWWHRRITWRDRRDEVPRLRALMRFHLSNGLVSLCGNLLLMRVLVQGAHAPVLVANAVAIVCCSFANFTLSSRWAFSTSSLQKERTIAMRAAPLMVLLATTLQAQTTPQTTPQTMPQALPPNPHPAWSGKPSDSYFFNVGGFCGSGATRSSNTTKPIFTCGAGAMMIPLPVFVELGVIGPVANGTPVDGYVSVDLHAPLAPERLKFQPQVLFGYSRLFVTGHALDYGLALALPRWWGRKQDGKSLRLEVRDYWTFTNPNQHNVMLRVGWMIAESD